MSWMNPTTWGKKKSSTTEIPETLVVKERKWGTSTKGHDIPPEESEPKSLEDEDKEEQDAEFQQTVKEYQDALRKEKMKEGRTEFKPFEEREILKRAQKAAKSGKKIVIEEIDREEIVQAEGVPIARKISGWYTDPVTHKRTFGEQLVYMSPGEQRAMAEQFRTARAAEHLTQSQIKQAQETSETLAPKMLKFQKGELEGALESQESQRRERRYAESLMPMQHQFTKGQMEIALDELKKEKFSRTKKGKTLRVLGKGFDSGLQAIGTGIAGAGTGAAYFTRTGGGPGTASITGIYSPQRMNTWTPGGSLHANTMNPAGRAMIPNLVNLNPAISVSRMGSVNPNLSPLSKNPNLSPLPKRRQVQPGVSKIQ